MKQLHGAYRGCLVAALAGAAAAGCAANPAPRLVAIDPALACGGTAASLTLRGDGFAPRVRDVFGQPLVDEPSVVATRVAAADGSAIAGPSVTLPAAWQDADTIVVTLAADTLAGAGRWDVTVANPGDGQSTLRRGLTVDDPPRVDSVTPDTLCSTGGSLTVAGAGFVDGATARLVDAAAGATLDAVRVGVNAPTQLTVVFGAVTTPPADLLDLVVENPDGCAGVLAQAVRHKVGGGGCP